ncbi:hypothetical protein Q7C36_006435 [Tachysurus vachellii]|uniref:Secreted protein n=1 Tax=Tachysurus vachellii TaxID=175792 RepID=A0AA88NCT7_TACVA|nr:hypothetical protein Q7C36_006435 [Tachysurus vachellii]
MVIVVDVVLPMIPGSVYAAMCLAPPPASVCALIPSPGSCLDMVILRVDRSVSAVITEDAMLNRKCATFSLKRDFFIHILALTLDIDHCGLTPSRKICTKSSRKQNAFY